MESREKEKPADTPAASLMNGPKADLWSGRMPHLQSPNSPHCVLLTLQMAYPFGGPRSRRKSRAWAMCGTWTGHGSFRGKCGKENRNRTAQFLNVFWGSGIGRSGRNLNIEGGMWCNAAGTVCLYIYIYHLEDRNSNVYSSYLSNIVFFIEPFCTFLLLNPSFNPRISKLSEVVDSLRCPSPCWACVTACGGQLRCVPGSTHYTQRDCQHGINHIESILSHVMIYI